MEFKKLVCENCGSSDFSYQENIYTCRHCGTKYILANDGNYAIYNYNINQCIIQMIMKKSFLGPKVPA